MDSCSLAIEIRDVRAPSHASLTRKTIRAMAGILPREPPVPTDNDPIALLRVPCNVTKVAVAGNRRTKRALIEAELSSSLRSKNHEELAVELALASQRLEDLDIFKKVACEVDIDPEGEKDAVMVSVKLQEKGTHTLSTGTYMQGGEGNVEVSWTMRNMLGNAEKVQSNLSVGHKTSNSFRLEGSQPLFFGSSVKMNGSIFQSVANLVKHSSFTERQRGISFGLASIPDGDGEHEISYEGAWRTVKFEKGSLVCDPSEGGDSFKSSIRHVFNHDTRDDTRVPSSGFLFRSTAELAGIGGDVKFLKNVVDVQARDRDYKMR
ncbi:hypothetical protein GUITHDRAFT_111251 [Guillardia theta CCMP2712]|uniref:Bacterial surface antigen (D15) domain-containing protein n=1 Tax=Guillardia theta (strain CCMP2712) TaxID=905079 RepID=L1J470_GUITC|nr:hypothetical protein GUITHDRAFT_111251 [Guillardia theta CCMP2712]EKX42885.1 hypothetical protein GUITHDRAFT_111251 [Guillardia theta CCMP2712]|eukprot:XP_005829865.1 hypothetical protein GUITHDRAFT_111251 [Guillardia theta CCMP2712]